MFLEVWINLEDLIVDLLLVRLGVYRLVHFSILAYDVFIRLLLVLLFPTGDIDSTYDWLLDSFWATKSLLLIPHPIHESCPSSCPSIIIAQHSAPR